MIPKFHSLKINYINKETEDCVSIGFEVPEELKTDYKFKAGQYLTLRTEIQNQDIRRSYSICSSEDEGNMRVAVKKVANGIFSTFANESLKVGMNLQVMTPVGNFCIHKKNETGISNTNEPDNVASKNNYVAFAAGSGITPIISIIKTELEQNKDSFFTLFYGNQNSEGIIFKEELEALKNVYMNRFALHYLLSREALSSPLFCGRINAEKCEQFAKYLFDINEVQGFYLCGPEGMVNEVKETLIGLGTDSQNIHFELFATGLQSKKINNLVENITEDEANKSSITLQLDGFMFNFKLSRNGSSVLDAALQNGADLPFACKGGVCCTCKAKVLSGEVRMDVNYALEPEEVAAGYVLTCQAHPVSQELSISFDE